MQRSMFTLCQHDMGVPYLHLSSTSSLSIYLLSTQIQPQLWVWGPHLHQYSDPVYKGSLNTVLSS